MRPEARSISSSRSTFSGAGCVGRCRSRFAPPSRKAGCQPGRDCLRRADSQPIWGSPEASCLIPTISWLRRVTSTSSRDRPGGRGGGSGPTAVRRLGHEELALRLHRVDPGRQPLSAPGLDQGRRSGDGRGAGRRTRLRRPSRADRASACAQRVSGSRARVRVDPGRIVVTQGFTQALDLLCRVLVVRGATTMAMETPSPPELQQTVRQTGLRLVGCPVDDHGLQTGELSGLHVDAVCVAPAHQFPTGAVMSPKRRLSLLQWAGAAGALVIEDDYDAEFRYDRTAVGAIQGLDPSRVAHVATASKVLAPGVRLAWMSLPDDFVDEVTLCKGLCDSGSSGDRSARSGRVLDEWRIRPSVVRAATPTGAVATS